MISKELLTAVKEQRAALVAQVKQIDSVLALFGVGVAAPAAKAPAKAASTKKLSASEIAKKAWATKKRNAAKAAKAAAAPPAANGADLMEAIS